MAADSQNHVTIAVHQKRRNEYTSLFDKIKFLNPSNSVLSFNLIIYVRYARRAALLLSHYCHITIEIIDLPGFGFVWGSSRVFLFTGQTDLKIVLALMTLP